VMDTVEYCRKCAWDVVHLPVDEEGLVRMDEAQRLIDHDTLLVCIMAVNNETGVKQDLKALSDLAHDVGAFFMTDATQAYGKMPLNVDEPRIDFMSFSAHKIYGPKGSGALYRRNRKDAKVDVEPQQFGGGQEGGVRSGTYNVPGIVGLAEAGNLMHQQMDEESSRVRALRDRFESAITQLDDVIINGAGAPRSYNISNITFLDTDVDRMKLEFPHIMISKGSACSSAKTKSSHVMAAMGRTELQANRTLRFSFGRFTTDAHVDRLIADVTAAHDKVRETVT
jgi:cysteine desulfurase